MDLLILMEWLLFMSGDVHEFFHTNEICKDFMIFLVEVFQ
jgi:hypothetical protein